MGLSRLHFSSLNFAKYRIFHRQILFSTRGVAWLSSGLHWRTRDQPLVTLQFCSLDRVDFSLVSKSASLGRLWLLCLSVPLHESSRGSTELLGVQFMVSIKVGKFLKRPFFCTSVSRAPIPCKVCLYHRLWGSCYLSFSLRFLLACLQVPSPVSHIWDRVPAGSLPCRCACFGFGSPCEFSRLTLW